MTETSTILRIDASGRQDGSKSRALADALIEKLRAASPDAELNHRDVAKGLPFVDAAWIEANFTPEEARTDDHRAALATSDNLVAELEAADIVVIATPMYNFGVPATLKAWIDMVARAGKTFRYTPEGPVGLLKGKKAYIVMATGGTEIGSEIDHASFYLRHILGFVGIDDVTLFGAGQLMAKGEAPVEEARAAIDAAASL